MSARHRLADREERKRRRGIVPTRLAKRVPSRLTVGGKVTREAAAESMQGALRHRPSARQWNAVNVPRIWIRSWDASGRELPAKRTDFRNVIDENGRHV